MVDKVEQDTVYMNMAFAMASLSYAVRKKVGCVAVTNNGVVLTGVNGLPKQLGNVLEYKETQIVSVFGQSPYIEETGNLITKPEVIHAELNCICKAAREGVSLIGSTFYITLSPCVHCASMLLSIGASRVVFYENYRDTTGIKLLQDAGVEVCHLEGVSE